MFSSINAWAMHEQCMRSSCINTCASCCMPHNHRYSLVWHQLWDIFMYNAYCCGAEVHAISEASNADNIFLTEIKYVIHIYHSEDIFMLVFHFRWMFITDNLFDRYVIDISMECKRAFYRLTRDFHVVYEMNARYWPRRISHILSA